MSTTEISITMAAIESSQLAAIGHDAANNTLTIQFKRGAGTGNTYYYQNVDAEQFKQFESAESIGSHFYKHIKPFAEQFPFKKID